MGKGEYHAGREYFIQLNDIQELGYVNVYIVKTMDVVIKGKRAVQKFVLEFGGYFSGSVWCK